MRKNIKVIFIIIFVIAFFVIGYVKNAMFVAIDWIVSVTIWQKFSAYFLSGFFSSIIIAFITALILTSIINFATRKRS
ncbi:hypothetical protein KPL47_20340 [Clostridium estertheticum]|uniref:hypothetical protein n=1 Tax=Clostridium estertheticum TaxID=238834 RepID=UPI001C0C2257|nr:hypothetical protein [Clostridium estertheticum]MBU3178664.1 hypothetical protein [Clostridium estertheticum]